uniref:Uncharacterized protein n=1 Tax=Arundo donax TaxID=35708 RepID=A0A0A9BGE7_ARUDO
MLNRSVVLLNWGGHERQRDWYLQILFGIHGLNINHFSCHNFKKSCHNAVPF